MIDPCYTIVRTLDGSYTLYLHEYEEHMHSLSGAYEEALLKHVHPSGILRQNKPYLQILDIGFGLGYNILASIIELMRIEYTGEISILSLEKEQSLLPALRSITFNDQREDIYSLIKNAYSTGSSKTGTISISVLFGDARSTILPLTDGTFNAVFFDPFSPSRNPELWSVDFFKHICRLMDKEAVLTTYSSAPQIRSALLEAGFIVGRGPSVGGKREGTLAAKTGVIPPLPASEIEQLMENFHAVPYRDPHLNADKGAILKQRSDEIKKLRTEHTKR